VHLNHHVEFGLELLPELVPFLEHYLAHLRPIGAVLAVQVEVHWVGRLLVGRHFVPLDVLVNNFENHFELFYGRIVVTQDGNLPGQL